MSEDKKTQGALLNRYMVAKDDMQPEVLAATLAQPASELLLQVDKKKVNKWLNDKEAIPHLLIPAVKKALGLDADQTYELRAAATELKTQLEAVAAKQVGATVAPAVEFGDETREAIRAVAEMGAAGANPEAPKFVGLLKTAAGVVGGVTQPSDAPVAVSAMSAEDMRHKRFAAGKALRDLMAATPLNVAEKIRRRSSRDGKMSMDALYVLVADLQERLKSTSPETLRLTARDLRARMNRDDSPPNVRISAEEATAIISALEQSVGEDKQTFNKAANAFTKAVEASQLAWDQLEAQDQARHAAAEAARAARAAKGVKDR